MTLSTKGVVLLVLVAILAVHDVTSLTMGQWIKTSQMIKKMKQNSPTQQSKSLLEENLLRMNIWLFLLRGKRAEERRK